MILMKPLIGSDGRCGRQNNWSWYQSASTQIIENDHENINNNNKIVFMAFKEKMDNSKQ